MTKNVAFYTLFLAFLISHVVSSNCETICGSRDQANSCYTDGLVYKSNCLATCANLTNVEYFECGGMPQTACQALCTSKVQTYNCQKNCFDTQYSGEVNCGSNGNIHSSLCKARCADPTIISLFNCNNIYYNNLNCRQVCTPFYNTMLLCASQPTNYVCSNVGLIFKNNCHLNAFNAQLLLQMNSNDLANQITCVAVAQSSGGSVGPKFRK